MSRIKSFLLKIALLVWTLSGHVNGTQANEQKLKFGIDTDFSLVFGPKPAANQALMGYKVAITLPFEWKCTKLFGLRSGIGYAAGHLGHRAQVETGTEGYDLLLDKIQIPLMGRFYPGKGRQFCLYIGHCFEYIVIVKQSKTDVYAVTFSDSFSFKNFELNVAEVSIEGSADQFTQISDYKEYSVFSFDIGSDYETNIGLIFGCETRVSFTSGIDRFSLNLGYNFAALL
ncbi:MAG: hypothetical protein K2X94_05000 [Amoebophilaceae bacterium]|nr:hypothetical protein [Amoebophilaceae bacterium]